MLQFIKEPFNNGSVKSFHGLTGHEFAEHDQTRYCHRRDTLVNPHLYIPVQFHPPPLSPARWHSQPACSWFLSV